MSRPLWTLAEVIAASGAKRDQSDSAVADAQDPPISGVSIDTRSLEPGDLFVPLTDARDGHDFVTAAFERGAGAALVRESYVRKPGDGTLLRVDDPLRALERIGIAARARLSGEARIVAVTGSAGKTGTKEMLRACLKVCAASPDKVHAPEKSYNNHWGVPLTLARMPADTEFGVFEIGMNHAGEIRPLTKMVRPHIAIVTNVLPVHVGNFEDGEIGVANAKAEIFEGLEAPRSKHSSRTGTGPPSPAASRHFSPPPGGEGDGSEQGAAREATAIIPRDGPHYELLRAAAAAWGAAVLTFGCDSAADVALADYGERSDDAAEPVTTVSAHFADGEEGFNVDYDLGMPGRHIAVNSLAVLLALKTVGGLKPAALRRLAELRPAGGRGARAIVGRGEGALLLLDESYNANPASMRAALESLATTDHGGRRVGVLGDMLELGADAIRYHVELKDAAERADVILCCGPNMRHLYDALAPDKKGAWAPSSGDLIPHVLATLRPGDAVMVKGSLGSRMAPIVEAIRTHFSIS